jgi:glutamate dehydrogenase
MNSTAMSASLEQSRQQLLHSAAERADHQGGEAVEQFLETYYRHVATEDLLARAPEDLLGAALAQREAAQSRPVGTAKVEVFNPEVEEHGWASGHTVVQVITDDMPFLVDSVSAELLRRGRSVHLLVHPTMSVRRDAAGELQELLLGDAAGDAGVDGGFGQVRESWMHLEIDRDSDAAEREAIADGLRSVLANVREAVEDWPKMRAACSRIAEELVQDPPPGIPAVEVDQAHQLLEWLADNHFTFLGYREYALHRAPEADRLEGVHGTGLGLLRYDPTGEGVRLSEQARTVARAHDLLVITKANSRATVHRSTYLDYISVKQFDEAGEVTGEKRFLGLFTSNAYTESVTRVPVVRDKVAAVFERSGFLPDSHSGKDLLEVLETYPRDELFQADEALLYENATTVLHLQERRKTKLFLRRDRFGRFMSCLVYIPRDRYNTGVRLRMESILRQAFSGATVDYTTRVSESVLARLHFVVRVPAGQRIPDVDQAVLERQLIDATRTWDEDLGEAARQSYGEEAAGRLSGLYGRAFPEAYKEDFTPRVGVADIRHMDDLLSDEATGLNMYQEPAAPSNERRFKLYRRRPLSLTQVLPVFTHMGAEVVDERPYEIARGDGVSLFIYDFGLRVKGEKVWVAEGGRDRVRELFQEAVRAVWNGDAESDGFNALVLGAGLTWRQVVILRTVAKYLRQTGSTFSQDYVESALASNPRLAARLVALFEARFDPSQYAGGAGEARQAAEEEICAEITKGLDDVKSLDHDRIIRAFLGVITATLRTNYYQGEASGEPKSYVSLKLNPKQVPDLPAPRPQFEIFVYSPRVEGVHLRFGPVARGGLRWSDRREDFRTEILGLVKAQMVKNAVIVPTGSKGGFYAKQLPDPSTDRDAWLGEGIAAYKVFISGLLDVTDNREGGAIVPPAQVVRHDSDDPYLVVAADKGTATFSDIANGVAQSYGFWLDDAFASGGSAGYDHKVMGITARGAWESVKRHFREMGVDTQTQDFTAVGIGDMSGDVFGNGMLLSEHIRLVAAFDHRHIFIDPEPDAATSFRERQRLFELPRSSWADYDTSLISEGGGVFDRSLKSVTITPEMTKALGLPENAAHLTPAELMKAILQAPVDLLWNGGIGTYVKAASESNADIGDRANDAIRVDGAMLRVKAIGEGGNLGLSQLGRVEASLNGVRVNTDAIDNSAGVDTSDHEVNIKILLTGLVRAGDLTLKQRNALLASMTDDVAHQVLRDNYEQNVLLGNARAQEHPMLPVHERLIHWLEDRGELDRALEFLPGDGELARRFQDGRGLKSPEFSVLVAYAKLALKQDLLPSELPDDPWFQQTLGDYFPAALREQFGSDLAQHPLRREIITNAVVNSMVNRGGITFAFRAMEETGATPEQIARAFVVCREIFDLPTFVREVEKLDTVIPTHVQSQLYLEFRRLIDRSVRWFLTSRPSRLDVASEVARFGTVAREFAPRIPELLRGVELQRLERNARALEQVGVPEEVALRSASLLDQFSLLDIVDIATDTGESPADVAPLYFVLSERFGIDAMLTRVTNLPRDDRWDALARGALRDDLYAVLESLVRSVMDASTAGAEPLARYEQWAKVNAESLARARTSLSGIERLDRPNIAALSVALRTLRSVIRSGAATS